jgi:hypothetical protein
VILRAYSGDRIRFGRIFAAARQKPGYPGLRVRSGRFAAAAHPSYPLRVASTAFRLPLREKEMWLFGRRSRKKARELWNIPHTTQNKEPTRHIMTRYNRKTGNPMLKVEICSGSACHNRGGFNVFQELIQFAEHDGVSDKISIETGLCMQQCDKPGVMVMVSDKVHGVDPLDVQGFYAKEIKPKI